MMMTSMRNVVFGYGDEPVVDNASLDIYAGEFVGITGPNGAAKTTILKLLLGLVKPWSGAVRMNAAAFPGAKPVIAYVPQQIASFNSGFPSKVMELVRSGCYSRLGLFKRFGRDEETIVEQSLKQVCMWELRHCSIGELSGGQKQRVCIARALAQRPNLLILDEPATGMDQRSKTGFYRLLRHMVTAHGLTVVMVTHDAEETEGMLDRIIRLERKEDLGWECLSTDLCSARLAPEQ